MMKLRLAVTWILSSSESVAGNVSLNICKFILKFHEIFICRFQWHRRWFKALKLQIHSSGLAMLTTLVWNNFYLKHWKLFMLNVKWIPLWVCENETLIKIRLNLRCYVKASLLENHEPCKPRKNFMRSRKRFGEKLSTKVSLWISILQH